MMHWRSALASMVALAAMSIAPAHADDYKIGVIHIERILSQSAAAKSAHDKIEKEFEPRNQSIVAREKELNDLTAQFTLTKATLTEDERLARARDIDMRTLEVQRLRQAFADDLHRRQFEELERLKERLDRVLTQLAKDRNYDLILQDALYIGTAVDITDEVIKALGP
jgi:outer membrane protein